MPSKPCVHPVHGARQWLAAAAAGRLVASIAAAMLLAACGGAGDEPAAVLPPTLVVSAPVQAEPGATVQMGSSASPTQGITYRWEFGDGNHSSAPAPAHLYTQPGRYRVSLLISNAAGETRSAEAIVRIGRFTPLQDARCVGTEQTGWCQQWPLDTVREIVLLQDLAGRRALGAGSDGRIYVADGAGGNWQEALLDTPAHRIHQIAFAPFDAETGWALGLTAAPQRLPGSSQWVREPLLLKTVDGGRQWTRQALPQPASPEALPNPGIRLQVLDPDHVVLADEAGASRWVSRDGGAQWTPTPWRTGLILPRQGRSMWRIERDPATQDWLVQRSLDLGLSFQVVLRRPASDEVVGFGLADDQHGWLVHTVRGPGAFELRERFTATRDGGRQWAPLGGDGLVRRPVQTLPTTVTWRDATRAIASNTSCGMFRVMDFYRSRDGGLSWSTIARPAAADFLHDLHPVPGSATAVWTTGRQGCGIPAPDAPTASARRAHLSLDLGQTWQVLEVGTEAADNPVQAVRIGADQSLLLDYPDRTYRSADGGQTWARLWPAPTTQYEAVGGRYAIAFGSANQGLAVAASGRVLSSRDGGRSWLPEGLVISDCAAGSTERQRMNQRGRIQFVDPAQAWVTGSNGIHRLREGVVDGPPSLMTADGLAARDLHFADSWRGWAVKSSPCDPPEQADFLVAPSLLWATTDGAQTWQEQARLDFQALGMHFADPRLGLVVGSGGAVSRTDDGGASWTRRESGTTEALRRVRFSDANTAWAVGAAGAGVRVSRDGGLSWQPVLVGSPHGWNGLFFLDANRGWIVGDFGSIASTRDGGRNWATQASGTLEHLYDVFAFDAETAWVIGERGVIRATATGGD